MNYIVAYTLKNDQIEDTYIDRWMPFLETEHQTIDNAKDYYNQILTNDGNEDGWHLHTIVISQIISSIDY